MAFQLWGVPHSRPTRDIDFLSYGNHSIDHITKVIREICMIQIQEDGLQLEQRSLSAGPIREGAQYEGVRVIFTWLLGRSRIPMVVDIGFGDILINSPIKAKIKPALPHMDKVNVLVYRPETVFAEKLHAIAVWGSFNSRMKDYFDLLWIIKEIRPDKKKVIEAVKATFKRRGSELPSVDINGFTEDFAKAKQTLWKRFIEKNQLKDAPTELADVIHTIKPFIDSLFR